jgi:hypothetical protein
LRRVYPENAKSLLFDVIAISPRKTRNDSGT